MIRRRMIFTGLALLTLAGCRDDSGPYLEFAGGGFIFNYRIADHYYGFVARVKKPLPEGGRLEARFDVPGADAPEVVSSAVREGQLQYMFRTSNLRGIMQNHPYKAVLVVFDSAGAEVARYERSFKTEADEQSLPDKPLVAGPGYQPAPGN